MGAVYAFIYGLEPAGSTPRFFRASTYSAIPLLPSEDGNPFPRANPSILPFFRVKRGDYAPSLNLEFNLIFDQTLCLGLAFFATNNPQSKTQ